MAETIRIDPQVFQTATETVRALSRVDSTALAHAARGGQDAKLAGVDLKELAESDWRDQRV